MRDKKDHTIHDRGYKKLFSNKTFVKELFHSFVKQGWVQKVDFDSLELVKTDFISEEFKERRCDILYKVKYQKREAYIFLLIEFQSSVDNYMALRMLRYILEYYEALIKGVNPIFS